VPAAGIVAEAMVALVLADALLEKFGGDHMDELKTRLAHYREQIRRWAQGMEGSEAPCGD
jgi:chorismate synthase